MEAIVWLEYARKTMQAYEKLCKPLCDRLGIPKTAFDILMFLANNPARNTAKDVVEIRGLKANLVSINVEKLVDDGYLERNPDPIDRRKVLLSCTHKAAPIVEQGRELQRRFSQRLLSGVPEDALDTLNRVTKKIFQNIDRMRGDGL